MEVLLNTGTMKILVSLCQCFNIFLEQKIKSLPYKRKLYLDEKSRVLLNQRIKKVYLKRQDVTDEDTLDSINNGIWIAPKIFGLTSGVDRAPLLLALRKLRRHIGVERQNLALDFSNTEKMYSDGALLFLAELKRLIMLVEGSVELTCILPKNNKIAQVLKQIGVLDILGVKSNIVPEDDDVVNWRCASGQKVLGQKYEDILSQYDGEITELLQDSLYTGITEAMTNVLNHAYVLKREDGLVDVDKKNWWMFSQQQNNCLSVVFCDLGAGIPRTLPVQRRNVWNRMLRKGIRHDGEIIKFAVKDSVSRTRKSHRGKGLRQIVQVIADIKGAEVLVLSNRGAFISSSGHESRCVNYSDSILGTLIFWRIPLDGKEAL